MVLSEVVETVGKVVESTGVVVIAVGVAVSLWTYLRALPGPAGRDRAYDRLRRNLGRTVLLGLEVLVAGDIIRTVALDPSLEAVAALGGIVLIRTFLSFTIETEISGRWPWQGGSSDDTPPAGADAPPI